MPAGAVAVIVTDGYTVLSLPHPASMGRQADINKVAKVNQRMTPISFVGMA
jgi:hypothetical protein